MQDILSYLTPEGTPERCGVVTKAGDILEMVNVHPEPVRGFRMDPSEILLHFSDAKATWHTHPGSDPNLSEEDYAGFMQWPALQHIIVGVREGLPTAVRFGIEDGVLVML